MVAMAEAVEINGIYYNLNLEEKTAEVMQNPNGYSGAIVIQEEVEYEGITYKVESIGISAFEYCNVTSITMPNSIKYIRDQAFFNSSSITNIVMSNNIESIGHSAFCGLEKIEQINIPNSVKEIGEYAFCRCKSVESFNIPDGVKTIGTNTFYRCEQLSSIILPSSIETISGSAFRECYQLQEIEIPEGVLGISGYAFFQCKQLAKVSLPSSLTVIGNHAFASCDDLAEITSYINTPFEIESTVFECYNKATLYIPKGTKELYENTKGWKRFANISELKGPSHLLIYILDGEEYKKYEVEEGSEITPEPAPTKEGYTFSGWSGIPETMPANDVTVTGTFTINKYKLTYLLDGEVYKSFEIEYGTEITPEAAPTKEGYSFSGWSEIPQTMPGKDVTVTGTFSINKYKLTYLVNGETYKEYDVEYGKTITPEAEPTKEGYTFSGWSDIPSTMPANDVTVTGSFTVNKYTLTYIVDGEVYKTYEIEYGSSITPEAAPTKEGYTFSGWSEIPETMHAQDVTVTGTFTIIDSNYFERDGIKYMKTSSNECVVISGGNYSGDIVIPEKVIINGKEYIVTSIGDKAFRYGHELTSVVIPYGVTSIGENAFRECIGLTSVSIPNSVTQIGEWAFCNTGLLSVTIPNSVTNIGEGAFNFCSGLTSVIIPKSVTSIGNSAFANCVDLNTVTMGNSVNVIGEKAFSNIPNLTDVYCYAESVPTIYNDTFEGSYIEGIILHVPANSVEQYKKTGIWKTFKDIVAIVETPSEKCATPSIAFANGQLTFDCETEGAEFVTNISLADSEMQNSNRVDLFSVYRFSVYAKKEGYADSDVATVNIDLNRLKGDMNNDGIISISDAVALVNIVLGGVSGPARYYSVGLDPVTADNYTTANDAQQVNSLNAIPSTLLTVTTPGVYYILLPEQFEPEVGGVVYFNVTKLNVTIPGYSVYRTASLSSGVQIKRVNVGTSGSQIDYE